MSNADATLLDIGIWSLDILPATSPLLEVVVTKRATGQTSSLPALDAGVQKQAYRDPGRRLEVMLEGSERDQAGRRRVRQRSRGQRDCSA